MARVKFLKIKPETFLKKVQNKTKFTFQELADICKVHRRSFSDWKCGRCLISLPVFRKLVKIAGLKPLKIKILPEYWHIKEAARKGALVRNKIYGSPGTPEGRSKGGKITSYKFHSDPAFAKKIGFLIRKKIYYSLKSPKLAELVGILMGDGGITNYQVTITLNKETDKKYTKYVVRLLRDVFHLKPTIWERKNRSIYEIVISSKNLVEYLLELGLKRGNKIKQKIDIPDWIKRDRKLKIDCLRGLIDTDGSFYVDIHKIRNKYYFNPGIDFSTHSLPLFLSVKKILKDLNYHPTGEKEHVRLRRENEIVRYFREIRSNNSKHISKFKNFLKAYRK